MEPLSRSRLYVFYVNQYTKDFQVLGAIDDTSTIMKGLLSSLEYPGTYDTDAGDVRVGVCSESQLHECSCNPHRFLLPHTAFSLASPGGFFEALRQLVTVGASRRCDKPRFVSLVSNERALGKVAVQNP